MLEGLQMDERDSEWDPALPDLANAGNELLVEEIRLLFIHYVIISLFCCTVHCIAILLSLFIQLMFSLQATEEIHRTTELQQLGRQNGQAEDGQGHPGHQGQGGTDL